MYNVVLISGKLSYLFPGRICLQDDTDRQAVGGAVCAQGGEFGVPVLWFEPVHAAIIGIQGDADHANDISPGPAVQPAG